MASFSLKTGMLGKWRNNRLGGGLKRMEKFAIVSYGERKSGLTRESIEIPGSVRAH